MEIFPIIVQSLYKLIPQPIVRASVDKVNAIKPITKTTQLIWRHLTSHCLISKTLILINPICINRYMRKILNVIALHTMLQLRVLEDRMHKLKAQLHNLSLRNYLIKCFRRLNCQRMMIPRMVRKCRWVSIKLRN